MPKLAALQVVLGGNCFYISSVLFKLIAALGLSLLSAVAVDLGFGAAFVDHSVGFLVTAYVGALIGILFGREGSSAPTHPASRVLISVLVACATLACLRTWALWSLPFSEFSTTGHSPYFVLPVTGLLVTAVLQGAAALAHRGEASSAGPTDPLKG